MSVQTTLHNNLAQAIRVLLVDDDEEACRLMQTSLARAAGETYELDSMYTFESGLEAMRRSEHDVYLVDYRLGQRSGINLIRSAAAAGCRAPMILMTASGSRDVDIQAMEAGAADYIEKDELTPRMLERVIRHVLLRSRDEREIARINAELIQKNEEMSQYVHTVSHDLKSPIITLMGYVGHLRRDIESQNYDRVTMCAERIDTAAKRMMRNIEDLLELSRAGRAVENLERVDVHQVIDVILAEREQAIAAKQVTVQVQPDLPDVVADQPRIRQVFDNLIGNALKYACDEDGATITVGGEATLTEIRFYVADNGPGIKPANHQTIFGLFQRLSNKSSGSGIGLAIVKRVAEVYDGRVWVESDVGAGTTFWIAIPKRDLQGTFMAAA